MEIKLTIPEPKFKAGDVVKIDNMIVHIHSVIFGGGFSFQNGQVDTDIEELQECYQVVVQPGSKYPSFKPNEEIRPGIILFFGMNDEKRMEKIEPTWEIVGPDTSDNWGQRDEEWRKTH